MEGGAGGDEQLHDVDLHEIEMNIYHSSGRSSRLRHLSANPAASHMSYEDPYSRQTSVLTHPPSPSDDFLQDDSQPDAANSNSVIYTAYPSPPNSAQSSQNSFNSNPTPLDTKFDGNSSSNNTLSHPPPLIRHGEELEHQSLETAIYTRLCHVDPPSQGPSPPQLIPIQRCIQLKAEDGASTHLWHASPNLDDVHWPHPPNSKKCVPEGNTSSGSGFPQPPSPISPPDSTLAAANTGE